MTDAAASPFAAEALADAYLAPEAPLVAQLAQQTRLTDADRAAITARAEALIGALRRDLRGAGLIDALLQHYSLRNAEGIALMRLAEALIRTPDFATARMLLRDRIAAGRWTQHRGGSRKFWVNRLTDGLCLVSGWTALTGGVAGDSAAARLGDRLVLGVAGLAMRRMGQHFVLGRDIAEAAARAQAAGPGTLCSFDMLGEAAHTADDAERYFAAYRGALGFLAARQSAGGDPTQAHGISVKLSALHPRYDWAQRADCVPAITAKLAELARMAKAAGLGLTIDAEECERLELSLLILEALMTDPALAGWDGLGFVVQAYQKRAPQVIAHLIARANTAQRRLAVRLVKGAYWDREIKRAQTLGLSDYPLFTHKRHSDISYLACARQLLDAGAAIYPQFATHNAQTAAAVLHMAGGRTDLEVQRLHGMGEELHRQLARDFGVRSRIYAPVGSHRDLLPYLVRRLLENGANSSFVNQLGDPDVAVTRIAADPLAPDSAGAASAPPLPLPRRHLADGRMVAGGADLDQAVVAARIEAAVATAPNSEAISLIGGAPWPGAAEPVFSPTYPAQAVGRAHIIAPEAASAAVDAAVRAAHQSRWAKTAVAERAAILRRAADFIEAESASLMALCVWEAGKTLPDAQAELREAVDFCRYYADRAEDPACAGRAPLGVVACISPWNFPLAIFLGQVAAALAAGNSVVAKPAPQTPLIAAAAVAILLRAGVPDDALSLLIGDGAALGSALSAHAGLAGLCFTGSTATAKRIEAALARHPMAPVPLIAETGGINVMIVDSTALLEQAVRDCVDSAFQSAGQRCSACRIVAVQDDIADGFEAMLAGAMAQLTVGNPAKAATDIGPIIDATAAQRIDAHIAAMRASHRIVAQSPLPADLPPGYYIPPTAIAIERIGDVTEEIFGPVLHLLRFAADDFDALIAAVNAAGYGLTMGLHSRIDARVQSVAARAKVGNLYVNRNQIGAVVGVQPFGGEGLSGTGPKAGGPHYLLRLSREERSQAVVMPGRVATDTPDAPDAPDNARAAMAQVLTDLAQQWRESEPALALLAEQASERLHREWGRVIALPGPTGEANHLHLHPRGQILCLGGEAADDLLAQALLTLASGSSARVVGADRTAAPWRALQAALARHDRATALAYIDPAPLVQLLGSDFDAVLAEGAQRRSIAPLLAERAGAIIPILSRYDDPYALFVERTVTTDLTAAGGDTDLLSR